MVTETVPAYDPWITFKKIIYEGVMVGVIAFLTYFVDIGLPGLALDYPAYAFAILATAAILTGIINWYKHRNDTKTIEK